jgi:hypothetical protein
MKRNHRKFLILFSHFFPQFVLDPKKQPNWQLKTKKPRNQIITRLFVNAEGFEPSTACLEGRCSIQLSYASIILLSGWQDSNLRPPAPKAGAITELRYTPNAKFKRRVRDSNPWYSYPYACLANKSFRPLRQLS